MGSLGVAVAHVCGSLSEYGVAVLAICLLIVLLRRPRNLPPGPTGLPVIGALHLLGQHPHETLARMAQKYGPLISFYMGQQLCLVASSPETAMEFLRTQDAVFCSRPPQRGFEVIFPKDVTFSNIHPASRHLRKILHLHLTSGRRIEESEHVRADEIAQMVRSIPGNADEVVDVKGSLEVMTANILTRLIISKRFKGRSGMNESEEKELQDFVEITEEIGLCLGIPNPQDVIPAFKWIDHKGLDRRLKNVRRRMEAFLNKIIAERRHRRSETDAEKDLLDVLLDEMDQQEITQEAVTSMVWEAFTAGMETTVLASEWTVAEIIRHPHIQARAQAEIDAVVGPSRRVQESDIPHLPYLHSVVKESFRLHPVLPLLIPHHSNSACQAFGYDIPAQTNLLVNVWAIGRDPALYTNPLEFRPERFLPPDGPHAATDWSQGFQLLAFSSGRRACMGTALGALLVASSVASLLHSFSWTPPTGDGMDMAEGSGLSVRKEVPLSAIAKARQPRRLY